jgi:hypothetical protein
VPVPTAKNCHLSMVLSPCCPLLPPPASLPPQAVKDTVVGASAPEVASAVHEGTLDKQSDTKTAGDPASATRESQEGSEGQIAHTPESVMSVISAGGSPVVPASPYEPYKGE